MTYAGHGRLSLGMRKRHARVIEVAQNDFNQYTSFLKDDAIVVPEDAEAVWLRTKVRTEYYSYEYSFDGERFTEIPGEARCEDPVRRVCEPTLWRLLHRRVRGSRLC